MEQTTKQLIRRANQLLKEQGVLVEEVLKVKGELQELEVELLKRNKETGVAVPIQILGLDPDPLKARQNENYRIACRIIDKSDPEKSIYQLERLGCDRLREILRWIDAVKIYRPKDGEMVQLKRGHGQGAMPGGAIVTVVRFYRDDLCIVEVEVAKFGVSVHDMEELKQIE